MALFESYERRIKQINEFLNANGIASLEEAVKQLKQFMESQSKKNSGFLKQIVEQERRIALLESCVFTKS